MKKPWVWITLLIVAVCGTGGILVPMLQKQKLDASKPKVQTEYEVAGGTMNVSVVESGTIDAIRVVELKSRAAGKLSKLLVEEGDKVGAGDLIAIIDPTETRLQVEQNSAQLRGAESAVARQEIEIEQRRATAQTTLQKAKSRLAQLERENSVQPVLTSSAISNAQAALDTAKKQRDLLINTTQPNERAVVQAELEQAKSNASLAESELKRMETLYGQEYVSLREVENQRTQVDIARSRLATAQKKSDLLRAQQLNERAQADSRVLQATADLNSAKANGSQVDIKRRDLEQARIAVREAEIAIRDVDALIASKRQAMAQADQTRSVLRDSQRQLSETEIRAPYAGVITKKLVQEGELVASLSSFSSGTPIARLEDRSSMIIKLEINEIDVAKLSVGMPAKIVVDAFPNKVLNGAITKVAPAKTTNASATDTVVRYEVEVTIKDQLEEIKSGMTAKCTMEVQNFVAKHRVPVDFVEKSEGKAYVYVLGDKAKPEDPGTKTEVQIGKESASFVEVLSGVTTGMKLRRPSYSGPKREGASITD